MTDSSASVSARPGVALVTGGTGFVGSNLARRLVRDGFEVHLLCRTNSNFWRLDDVLPRLHRHVAPLEDAARVAEIVRSVRPEYVFHLAASTVVAGTTAGADDLVGVNLLGTIHLLDACAAVDCRGLVTTGDSFEYSSTQERLAEDAACHPDTLHGISKLAATLYAQSVAKTQGRPVVTLRLFSTYGPGDHPRRLVPRVIAGALAGTPLSLSRPEIARDWVYVDDVIELYLEASRKARQHAGGVFNAGSGIATSVGAIVESILTLTGSAVAAQWGVFPAPPHDAFPWIADTRRTCAAFDWRPQTALDDGLRLAIAAMAARAAP